MNHRSLALVVASSLVIACGGRVLGSDGSLTGGAPNGGGGAGGNGGGGGAADVDAGFGAPPAPTAPGTPPPPPPPPLVCGDAICEGVSPVCCVDPTPRCAPDGDCTVPPGWNRAECTNIADCLGGELCCFLPKENGGLATACVITNACPGLQSCVSDEECAEWPRCNERGICGQ